jgi:hypothetical protein
MLGELAAIVVVDGLHSGCSQGSELIDDGVGVAGIRDI